MRAACTALLAALAGCGPAVLGVQVNLVTKACPGADLDPVKGVTRLRFKLSGDGLLPQTTTIDYGKGAAQLPNVAIGANRRLTVEALEGTKVRARADSGRFDALGPDDVALRLFLRPVDAFAPAASQDASACAHLVAPRAGHAMTLLPDGRVLVTGGYGLDGSPQPRLVYHDDAEVFDPQTGVFTALASGPSVRRAGHTALFVTGAQGNAVLLAGGEGPSGTAGDGPVTAAGAFELFARGTWLQVVPKSPTPARSHLASAVDLRTGAAVFAGGQNGPDKPGVAVYDTASFYDPAANAVKNVAAPLRVHGLSDAVAVARANVHGANSRGGVVLVGGRDSTGAASAQLSGLIWNDTAQDYVDDPDLRDLKLSSPRAHHIAVRMRDDTVLTAGGVTALTVGAFDDSNATAAVTLIDPGGASVRELGLLSQARADSCAAVLEDGTVLIAGGAWKDATGLHSARQVDLVSSAGEIRGPVGPSQGDGTLSASRYRAACVRLKDGSVLVSGGLQVPAGGGTPVVLDSVEIYTPPGTP